MSNTDNKQTQSWIHIPAESDFTIHNFPYGVCEKSNGLIACCTRLGDTVINLNQLLKLGYLKAVALPENVFQGTTLNEFISQGRHKWKALRSRLITIFDKNNLELQHNIQDRESICTPITDVKMLIPIKVGDYTDFYSSKEHATNVGKMFRPDEPPLKPNWTHMPIAYHGRSSTIVTTKEKIRRPLGQIVNHESHVPELAFTKALDIELEMGFITSDANLIGEPVPVNKAHEFIFGMVLLNDWSARDIQKWEYVPLGPFLGKNFATSISPWIVTMDALENFKTDLPVKNHTPLEYLKKHNDFTYDINLEVDIISSGLSTTIIKSNYKYLYWSISQQLAHHTINGCKVNAGDLMGSGTISGSDQGSFGSLLELSWAGSKLIKLDDGTTRTYLEDMDIVVMRGKCERDGIRIGFGELSNQIISGTPMPDSSSKD
ncbi:fumarylacetoacetase [Nonlabens ponticola]|uniref:fumarylacetoacetase n=1 Tax=Nonlabens ponticola TaxID=2496866 RepID=A0A3S9N025_9FLAO|nr:fumarylacetoacetase [Nonlabens ponticola]AZQ44739.1 fumarylacetoacetase [Nonlabens ponticola]